MIAIANAAFGEVTSILLVRRMRTWAIQHLPGIRTTLSQSGDVDRGRWSLTRRINVTGTEVGESGGCPAIPDARSKAFQR